MICPALRSVLSAKFRQAGVCRFRSSGFNPVGPTLLRNLGKKAQGESLGLPARTHTTSRNSHYPALFNKLAGMS